MIFSHVKISSFRVKAHLVFHWCLYNNITFLNEVESFVDCYFVLSKVFSVILFDKEEIHQDLHLIVAESQDESTFVVYGQMYVLTMTMPLGLFIIIIPK